MSIARFKQVLAQRIRFIALLLCTVLVVALVIQTIKDGGGKSASVAPPKVHPLVGTWLGPGNILDLRPDGTARGRSIKSASKEVQYFEWSVEGERLAVMMAAKPQEHMREIRQFIFGTTTFHYDIVTVSPTELRLLDKDTGKIRSFISTDDPTLQSSP